ncbi:MAG: segregation ATPase FtsK/SpoIIIE, family [Solirubrobacteraceae bacterium]|jgi:S-DNA-T family DNA segregation ATPase FtsK/SpoIIIE|nr:segregation ATPase FtsK/SpoIIIE, family [Solirubrobacteraceae bacterium]
MPTVEELQADITALRRTNSESQERLQRLVALARAAAGSHAKASTAELERNLAAVTSAAEHEFSLEQLAWDHPGWLDWEPDPRPLPASIALGSMREQRTGADLGVPYLAGLIGARRAIVIRSSGAAEAATATALLQSLVVRTSVLLPQQTRYTLLDPGGHGTAFPMARYLARVATSSGDVRRDLDAVTLEIQRIVQTYLDAGTPAFDEIAEELRLSEAFHFVFAANFPQGYDLRAAEALQSIARSGPAAGVYLVLHYNVDIVAPIDISRYAIETPIVVDAGAMTSSVDGLATTVTLDGPPSADLQKLLLERIGNAPPIDRPVTWDDIEQVDPDSWWSEQSAERIEAPVGRHGANQERSIYFGVDKRDRRPCAHGVLAAMTGAGKTELFHTYIAGLVTRYSPKELQLFLLDGKFGVSFRSYRQLPHAQVVSLRTRPELARSVLRELLDEMERRNELFKSNRIEHYEGYRGLGSPDGALPRILLIADEFQLLFEDDRDQAAANALLRLSEQARSAGIHLLLGSQHFAPANMTHRNLVFANMHLRMAMQLTDSDVNSTTDFGPNGRRLISATCDRPGRLVFNDRAGNDSENTPVKVAKLEPERRAEIVEAMRAKWTAPTRPIVFDGDRQPDLLENPLLELFLAQDQWPAASAVQQLARRSPAGGGIGVPDWLSAECPMMLFLGQAFSVRGQASVVLRRRQYEHLLVVGEQHSERIAVLGAAVVSACAQVPPGRLRLLIADRSIPGTEWASTLPAIAQRAQELGYAVERSADEAAPERYVDAALAEVDRRRALVEEDRQQESPLLVVLSEPDRSESLRRIPDDYGFEDSPAGRALQLLLDRGPAVGVHVLASFTTVGTAVSVVGPKRLQAAFRHKVAMQMSEDDSFVMVRSPRATKLQPDGPRPVAALLFDAQSDQAQKFKPYTIIDQSSVTDRDAANSGEPPIGTFDEQTAAIFGRLKARQPR